MTIDNGESIFMWLDTKKLYDLIKNHYTNIQ